MILLIISIILFYYLLFYGYIVFDRNVFGFQINRVLKNNKIKNLRDFKIVHNYIEQTFDRNPNDMDNNPKIDSCNKMMEEFEKKN